MLRTFGPYGPKVRRVCSSGAQHRFSGAEGMLLRYGPYGPKVGKVCSSGANHMVLRCGGYGPHLQIMRFLGEYRTV
jgi:hypothetical protein